MPSEEVKIGPFTKGLNTISDRSAIDDLEVSVLDNFELDINGSLVNRPPIKDTTVRMPTGTGKSTRLLGFYVTSAGAAFLIGSDSLSTTYYYNGTSWIVITNTFAASAIVQYKDKVWLLAPPTSGNPGGSWDGTTFAAIATMPKGKCIAVHKERLWIGPGRSVTTNGARIYFCAISDPTTWAGDFITVGTGDGQNVLDMLVYFQDIIIFKNDSTYKYTYDTDPALGAITRISDTVGTFDSNCVCTFQNRIFVLHSDNLFELTNYTYDRINTVVPFTAKTVAASLAELASVSYFSDRIFVSFYGNTYVWSVRTRTWSTWTSATAGLTYIGKILPIPRAQDTNAKAYTYSSSIVSSALFTITDAVTNDSEQMACTVSTKYYDYQTSSKWKRLFKWGIDCSTVRDVVGTVVPVQYASTMTWGQAKLRTWGDAKQFTWGRPSALSADLIDTITIQGITGGRKFLKLGVRSIRFRQVGFTVVMDTNGSTDSAPVVLYHLITYVSNKQGVTKRVS